MAIARNLNRRPQRGPLKLPEFFKKNQKKIIIGAIIFSIVLGVYGVLSLSHLAVDESDKQDLVYETGDQPLPEKLTIVINADGGLNMRSEPDANSQILKTIPDKTKLEALELTDGWYKITYEGATGWVNEKYVSKYTEDTTTTDVADKTYQNATYGYSLSYPTDWVTKDYGSNQAASLLSYVGFGSALSDEIDSSVLPPVAAKVTKDAKTTVDADYKKRTSSVATTSTVSGLGATKYVFTASSGVQMTAYVVASGGYTFIIEESGGYADELTQIIKSFKLNQ